MKSKTPPTTSSGIKIKECYFSNDHEAGINVEKPGEYPYTRGIKADMYLGRLWTMRQYAGFATARESNLRYRYLLEQGQTGLSVAFDLPTQIGYDSDSQMARGEVGKTGVAIDSLADMEILLDQIPLDRVSVSMTINSTAAILLSMLIAVARKQGHKEEILRGTIQNDILKEYIARGTYIFPVRESLRLITDIFSYCNKSLPKFNTISISGYHIREAGSSAVQELAFTFCNAICYVETALKAGLKIDDFAPRLSFFFNAHNNFFEEAAKFRAARRVWARIVRDRFGAKSEKSLQLRFHTQTGGSTLTAQQVENNTVRVAYQALASVLGGTQSLHTNSRDEALSLPTEDSARLALRTQQIIACETGVTETVDPLAGSYFVEALTEEIVEKTEDYIKTVDAMGGSIAAIERRFFQDEIRATAYRSQKEIDTGERLIVGVNSYEIEEGQQTQLFRVSEDVAEEQKQLIESTRNKRDKALVEQALKDIRQRAGSTENLMPALISAVEAYATLGEISNTLREVWGEYRG